MICKHQGKLLNNDIPWSLSWVVSRVVTWKDSLCQLYWPTYHSSSESPFSRFLLFHIFKVLYSEKKREREREAPPPIIQQGKNERMWGVFIQQSILQLLAFNKLLHCLSICSNSNDTFFGLGTLYFCLYLQLGLLLGYFFLSLILCLHLNQEYKYWT